MSGGGSDAGIAGIDAVWQLQHLLHEARPFSAPPPLPPPPNIIRADAARLHGTRDATGAVNELEHAKSAATTIRSQAWRRRASMSSSNGHKGASGTR